MRPMFGFFIHRERICNSNNLHPNLTIDADQEIVGMKIPHKICAYSTSAEIVLKKEGKK